MRILLVEDETDLGMAIERVLVSTRRLGAATQNLTISNGDRSKKSSKNLEQLQNAQVIECIIQHKHR